jgi:hypothetical protein
LISQKNELWAVAFGQTHDYIFKKKCITHLYRKVGQLFAKFLPNVTPKKMQKSLANCKISFLSAVRN